MPPMSFNKRLLLAQEELQSIALVKDATNPFFKSGYLTLGKLLDTVVPVLNKHGIILMQPLAGGNTMTMTNDNPQPTISTYLKDSESEEGVMYTTPLVLGKIDPQGLGSAVTYTRRYALMSFLGLSADEDDDANSAMPEEDEVTSAASKASGKSGSVL